MLVEILNIAMSAFAVFTAVLCIYVLARLLRLDDSGLVRAGSLLILLLATWFGVSLYISVFMPSAECLISNVRVVRVWAEGRWQSDYYTSLDIDGEIKTYEVRGRDDWGSLSAGEQVTVTVVNDSEIVEVQR